MSVQVDVTTNRRRRNYALRIQCARMAWALCAPLFRYSPRVMWGWRIWLLRRFGAHVGQGVHIYPTVRITMPWHLTLGDQAAVGDRAILYALGHIHIGARATVSQYAHICTGSHDWRDPARPLIMLPVHIAPDAWICADAFVGPGVRIGNGAILGARSVAMKDLPDLCIGTGNPVQIRAQQ